MRQRPDGVLAVWSYGMESRWTLDQLLGYYSTWSATNRYITARGINPLEPLAAKLREVWGDPTRRGS